MAYRYELLGDSSTQLFYFIYGYFNDRNRIKSVTNSCFKTPTCKNFVQVLCTWCKSCLKGGLSKCWLTKLFDKENLFFDSILILQHFYTSGLNF